MALGIAWGVVCALAAGFGQNAPGPLDGLRVGEYQFEDERGDVRYSLITGAGTQVVMSFRVDGFERERVEEQGEIPEEHVHLEYEAEMRDPEGVLIEPPQSGEVDTLLGPRDTEWRPRIRWSAALPSYAPTGQYKISIRVKDVLSGDTATGEVPVRVRGEAVQPATSLGVQQLEYANTANGPWFSRRFYAPGRPIHVRYKVAGFQVSPDNEVWVEQDWTILDADGNVIVTQPNVIVTRETHFYPPRFFPGVFDLRLEDPKPGAYTFRIAVRDRIARQSISTESQFFVRP